MDGILNILKPSGMTSHDVVAYIRRLTGIKKVGHTGTLDPAAAGVLPICLGKATKAAQYIADGAKQYRAEMKLGVITNTGDATGDVIEERKLPASTDRTNFKKNIDSVFENFTGTILQMPPMYSAVKVKGKKLYELARKGQEIERKPREIQIYSIAIVDFMEDEGRVLFDVTCSKGTYIRTLCEDIGKQLGYGAHMSYLVRTTVSEYDIKNSITLEQLEELTIKNNLNSSVLRIETVFIDKDKYVITNNADIKAFLNGVQIKLKSNKIQINDNICVYYQTNFIGLGKVQKKNNEYFIKAERIFI